MCLTHKFADGASRAVHGAHTLIGMETGATCELDLHPMNGGGLRDVAWLAPYRFVYACHLWADVIEYDLETGAQRHLPLDHDCASMLPHRGGLLIRTSGSGAPHDVWYPTLDDLRAGKGTVASAMPISSVAASEGTTMYIARQNVEHADSIGRVDSTTGKALKPFVTGDIGRIATGLEVHEGTVRVLMDAVSVYTFDPGAAKPTVTTLPRSSSGLRCVQAR